MPSVCFALTVVNTGANDELTEQEVIESTKVIASSAVLAAQLEIDPRVSLAALKLAKEHKVSLDTYLAMIHWCTILRTITIIGYYCTYTSTS